jgi:hypothetical protein
MLYWARKATSIADRHEKAKATRRTRVQAEILRKTKLFLSDHSPLVLTHRTLSPHVGYTPETIRRHFPDIDGLALRVYECEIRKLYDSNKSGSPRETLTGFIIRLATTIIQYPSLGDRLLNETKKAEDQQNFLYQSVVRSLDYRITAFRKEQHSEARSSHQKSVSCLKTTIAWSRTYREMYAEAPDADEIEAFAHRTATRLRR